MTSSGTQNTIVLTDQPEFPWEARDKLYAIPLNNKFVVTDQQLANMTNQIVELQNSSNESHLGINITANWGGNNTPSAGPYMLIATSPYDFTVISLDMSVGDGGGSFVVTFLNAGTAISGLENVVVASQQRQQVLADANQVVTRGSEFSMRISDIVGFPLNSWVSINGTTNAFSEPVIGVTTGTAVGMNTAVAVGSAIQLGQGLATTSGAATVQGTGMASASTRAASVGSLTVAAQGVQITTGGGAGSAIGSSIVSAEGTSTVTTHVFVMDDPQFGILDTNPLD